MKSSPGLGQFRSRQRKPNLTVQQIPSAEKCVFRALIYATFSRITKFVIGIFYHGFYTLYQRRPIISVTHIKYVNIG